MVDEIESKGKNITHFHGNVGMAIIDSKEVHHFNAQQIWDQFNPNIQKVANELALLKERNVEKRHDPEQFCAVAVVAEAEEIAKQGDRPKALACLRKQENSHMT